MPYSFRVRICLREITTMIRTLNQIPIGRIPRTCIENFLILIISPEYKPHITIYPKARETFARN